MERSPELNKAEAIQSQLEDFPIFGDQDKAYLVLVSEGLKKVCDIEIYNPVKAAYKKEHEGDYEKNTREFEKSIERLKIILKEYNLPFSLKREYMEAEGDNPGYDAATFDIGKDQESLDALVEINKEPNDEIREAQRGRMFEIPDTAIKNWIRGGNFKDHLTLPEDVQGSEYFHFIDFALSEDHWEEELETVKQRAETIKRITPQLYEKIISKKTNDIL